MYTVLFRWVGSSGNFVTNVVVYRSTVRQEEFTVDLVGVPTLNDSARILSMLGDLLGDSKSCFLVKFDTTCDGHDIDKFLVSFRDFVRN